VYTLGGWSIWRLSFGLYGLMRNAWSGSLVLGLMVVGIKVLSALGIWMLEGM